MRIAILGASHWHVGIYYLPALQSLPVEIVGLADPDPAACAQHDPEGRWPHYTDWQQLLDDQRPDLVFAHAPHSEMTALAAGLVARGQAFHIEKPAGIDARALQPVVEAAEAGGVFNSVALVTRYVAGAEKLAGLRADGELGQPLHYYFRLFAGTPQRYRDWGVDWMLDPARAGAGPLMNFGPHGVDLFLLFTGEPVARVSCWTTHNLFHEEIEDLASIRLEGAGGTLGTVEVGYALPGAYERYFSLTTDRLHVGGILDAGQIIRRDGEPLPYSGLTADQAYHAYTADIVTRYAEGRPARITLADMLPVLRVVNLAQESLSSGGAWVEA
ncbi:MAG TPA: Gfo/Idh/MocA family oxidoreductase [Armatimonadota bacterium]|jgi:predicted dehydrogenase